MAEQTHQPALTILRCRQVEARIGLGRSTIYSKMKRDPKRPKDFDPAFPKPVSIGARAVGWLEHEVEIWLAAQIRKSRKA